MPLPSRPPASAQHPCFPGHPPPNSHKQAALAAQALTAALQNPYSSNYACGGRPAYGFSSHYAQAYAVPGPSSTLTTPDGYTISSTYVPVSAASQSSYHRGGRGFSRGRPAHRDGGPSVSTSNYRSQGSWYEPGNHRCTQQQCPFTGSKKSVEIHMMDRHLIYPSGWEKTKREDDWDADLSLKGKRIAIQGTNIVLDSQEAIDAWIAERKKRWPSSSRVEEKQKKIEDAVARGEIFADDRSLRGNKRRRTDSNSSNMPMSSTDGGWRGRGRGNGRGSMPQRGGHHYTGRTPAAVHHPLPPKPQVLRVDDVSSSSDSESGSDMDPEKDAVSSKVQPPVLSDIISPGGVADNMESNFKPENVRVQECVKLQDKTPTPLKPFIRKPPPQPKAPPQNAFTNRTSLLHNLLLPEIRTTVSNLSQAIRFLVENDFLENVELKPGDANSKRIEVIDEQVNDNKDNLS